MKVFSLFKAEMAGLAAKKGLLVSVIIALLVPVVYGGILLSPRWGPYDNLSNLPVAVVNNDQGADSDGETINAGKDLVADLEKGKNLGWKFVDSDEAKSGMKSLKYYMVIEIPKDFSKRVTTVLSTDPQKPELKYVQNEGLNFMAAQVTKSATEQIRERLADRITEKYVNTMFASLQDVSDGFQTAADGSEKLNGGTSELHKGTGTLLESLTKKSGDISRLAAGTRELEKGTGKIYQSLSGKQNDIKKLANGAAQVNNGLGQVLQNLTGKQGDIKRLSSGSHDLKDGTNELLSSLKAGSGDIAKLAVGSEKANEGTGLLLLTLKKKQQGVEELAAGAKVLNDKMPALKQGTEGVLGGLKNLQNKVNSELRPGTQAVAGGVAKAAENAQALGAGLQGLSSALNSYLEAHPDLRNDPNFMKIVGTGQVLSQNANDPDNIKQLGALKDGSATIASAFSKEGAVTAGLDKLVAGQSVIDNGVGELNEKAPQLKDGTAQIAAGWNTMVTKVGDLHAGTAQIAAGNQSVNEGWSSMTDGVRRLDSGAWLLSAGNDEVNNGWKKLIDGTSKLNNGSGQVSRGNADVDKGWKVLTAGADKIHSGTVQVSDGNSIVEKGWGDLTSGVTRLNDGAEKLNDGSGELASGLKDGAAKTSSLKTPEDKNFNMFASPVQLKSDKVFKFAHYRDSTAPYVLTLALFTGILIMSMFMNFKRPEEVSAAAWFGAKLMNLSVLAIAQALLLSLVVMILAVNVENPAGFVLFAIFVSIVFSAIVSFFAALGMIGRFLGLAFVVLQLSITGANLPIDMLPPNMRALSEFLPFTYSIAGFKALLALDAPGTALFNASVLFIYLGAFALLAFAVILVSRGRRLSREDTAKIQA
ncbi:YhgE/Pip domain-containing protein [Fictibacillus sp. NRS-1165]|uniref:YhgE/Pip domain-containing protein n=1 Tax=Fictibacillus sp. NRS-1165 TaxID=3144463 RepID=UPI003D23AB87